MPQNTTVSVPAKTWTQLTDGAVSAITFQNIGSGHILVKCTVGATPPSDFNGALRYNPGQGERNVLLSDLAPGLAGRDRLYAWAEDAAAVVVSNA